MNLAFVFVECEDGRASAVKNSTEKVDGVQVAYSISGGDYDILVKVNANDHELHAALSAIRRISDVAALATSIVCKTLG
jgi:uncharacterized protein with GYD domain